MPGRYVSDEIDLQMVDLGRDAVAQQQPDGRVVVAVRPHQSFPNAVEKVREAVEKARGVPVQADTIRNLLRPHWPPEMRADVPATPGADPRRRATDFPDPDVIPDAPAPISMRVPLRRRNVQLGMLFSGVLVLASGFLIGWGANDAADKSNGTDFWTIDSTLWEHELFSVFAKHGATCSVTSAHRASCVDIYGTVLTGEAMHSGPDTLIYEFFYGDGLRTTFYVFDNPRDMEVWGYREGVGEDLAYGIGNVLVAGEDEDQARVLGYAKIVADHYDRPVEEYGGNGPPQVVYRPRA